MIGRILWWSQEGHLTMTKRCYIRDGQVGGRPAMASYISRARGSMSKQAPEAGLSTCAWTRDTRKQDVPQYLNCVVERLDWRAIRGAPHNPRPSEPASQPPKLKHFWAKGNSPFLLADVNVIENKRPGHQDLRQHLFRIGGSRGERRAS